jgi:hypothetical protein
MLTMTPGHLVKRLRYFPNRKAVNREKTAGDDGPFQVDFMKRANPRVSIRTARRERPERPGARGLADAWHAASTD